MKNRHKLIEELKKNIQVGYHYYPNHKLKIL